MEQHELDPNPCQLDAATLQRLADLVSRAHARTSATGVAIALIEAHELVTCAAFGSAAPEVGTRSPIEGSFSGRCAHSGEMQICEDVTRDERVNGEACTSVGIFSMVMVPVSDSGIVRGVMAAFSDRPNSFSPSQLTVLNTFAEITNELLHHRDQAASGEVPTPVASVTDPSAKCETVLHDVLSAYEIQRRQRMTETPKIAAATTEITPAVFAPAAVIADVQMPAASTTASPVAGIATTPTTGMFGRLSTSTPVTTSATASAPVLSSPATEVKSERLGPQIVRSTGTRGGAATKMAPAPTEVSEPVKRDESKVEKDSELLSFAADPMPMKTSKVTVNSRAERSSPGQDNELFSTYATEQKAGGSSPVKFVLGGAAVLVLAAAVFGFSHIGRKTETVIAAPVQETSAPAPTTPTTAPVETASAPITPTAAVTKSAVSEAHVADDTQKKDNAARTSHAVEPEPEPLAIKQPNGSVNKKAPEVPDVQAPRLLAGLTAGKMPQLSATVVPPKADFPIASVTAPKLLNGPRPVFPQAANVLHLTGDTVVLNAKVLTNGKVGDISVVRGKPVFVQAVRDAVKHWQYAPAQLNNQATDATIEIVFKFGPGQ